MQVFIQTPGNHWWALAPMLLALVSCAYFVTTLPTTPRIDGEGWVAPLGLKPLGDDAVEYVALSDALREDSAFAFQGEPTRMRSPLYLFLLAAAGGNVRAVQWAQTAMIIITISLVYLIGRQVWSHQAGLVASGMIAAFTPMTIRSALMMSEALFIVLLLAGLHAMVVGGRARDWRWLAAAGVWLGLATLARPVTILLPVALIPVLVAGYPRAELRQRLQQWARPVGVFVAVFLLVLVPWTTRNAVSTGAFTPMPSSGGVNLWAASHPDWREFVDNHMAYAWELPEFDELRQGEYYISAEADGRFRAAAIDRITADPVGWFTRNTAKLSAVAYASFPQELLGAVRVRELRGDGRGLVRLVGLGTLLSMALAVIGAGVLVRRRAAWLLLATIGYFYAIEFVSFAEARHLLPLVPLYALLAAVGLTTASPVVRAWFAQAAADEREREAAKARGDAPEDRAIDR
jgi:4-amino-4-deoxy-L-arabinose transferase-like glycosyltransferase